MQLYEAVTMLLAGLVVLAGLWRRSPWFMAFAFYAVVFVYAAQRFAWEFLKPYAALVGPLNVFHFLCLALLVYSVVMVYLQKHDDA